MYVHVKSFDGKTKITLATSRLTTIGAFKKLIQQELDVSPKQQRLFFRGKQLENNYSLFDYDVNLNDVIQLMISKPTEMCSVTPFLPTEDECINFSSDEDFAGFTSFEISRTMELLSDYTSYIALVEEEETCQADPQPSTSAQASCSKESNRAESLFYRVNDIVDVKDNEFGSWLEGKILEIQQDLEKKHFDKQDAQDDGLLYRVQLLRFPEDDPTLLKVNEIRPRARQRVQLNEIEIGDRVMVNYNVEDPKQTGYWYDLCVTKLKPLTGTLFVGTENAKLNDAVINCNQNIFRIEKHCLLVERSPEELELLATETDFKREYAPYCNKCRDDLNTKCKECSCNICGGKDEPGKQVMCDECSMVFHFWCLDPPLASLPEDDYWYCPDCKNDENEIVKAGGKLKQSKKKAKLASSVKKSNRDWGKGMACVGRTKVCNMVPTNHFGPIPGIEVGTSWKFRVQVSEAGVHRPHVAGIAGRESEGAYSIVFSGGYEGDKDFGDEFLYTGSGGRDLSGNKRIAEQSSDQTLTRMNKALALNCNADLDDVNGADAGDKWRGGKPVRVVRNYKAHKHSQFSPQDGNRYDGIYKVVKYMPEKGPSGYVVWRFLLRRDDAAPAPWTEEGKRRIASLGLELIYPDGYLEAMEIKEKSGKVPVRSSKKRKLDQVLSDVESNNQPDNDESTSTAPPVKLPKYVTYELTEEEKNLIDSDQINSKLWDVAKESLSFGKQKFLSQVEEVFMCVCCQEILYHPVTTPCLHNICQGCVIRSFGAEVYSCPYCRNDLGKDYEIIVNDNLQKALSSLFPGYSQGR